MESNLEKIIKAFEGRVSELTPDGLAVELRVFVEAVRREEADRIEREILKVQSRWTSADKDNDTLRNAAICTDVLLTAIQRDRPARRELLEMVAAYDKQYFGYDE